jgi:uncharacterized membrane protein
MCFFMICVIGIIVILMELAVNLNPSKQNKIIINIVLGFCLLWLSLGIFVIKIHLA